MGIVALGPAFESGIFAGTPRGEVLRALCNHADDDRFECWPSYEFIAFVAGIGRSTAARELKALITLGLVEIVEAGGGRRRANRYRVNVPLIEICRDRVRAAKRAAGPDSKARIEAMNAAREACEKLLQNRPAGGRFPEENRPAGDQNRPAHDTETVPPVDPNLKKNLNTEKTRARGGGDPDGPPPRGAEGALGDGHGRAGPSSPALGPQGAQELEPLTGGGAGAGKADPQAAGETPGRAMTEGERRRFHHRQFLLDWLHGRAPMAMLVRQLGLASSIEGDRPLDPAAVEAIALGMAGTYLRDAVSLVGWAESALAGERVATPIASVEYLMQALADPARRALMARRLALLRDAAARARDGPDTDEQAA